MRVCPACNTRTKAKLCPKDGRPTIDEATLRPAKTRDPMIGYVLLGKYEIESRLGAGGFGSVYKARLLTTGGHIAIKLLRGEVAEDPDVIKRFYVEAQNTHQLHHANTVRVSDFGRTEDGTLYLIMELVPGTPLSRVMRKEGRLPPARVVRIAEQVLKSLAEAHVLASPVVHRDIKPDNVMLLDQIGEKDFVKVLDFGISRATEGSGAGTRGAIGTPKYMAPEQWKNDKIDGRADLYSVGCMMYEMIAGRAPIEAEGTGTARAMVYMRGHLQVQPAHLDQLAPGACPPALAALVMTLLEKDRGRRPPTAQAVLAALNEIKAAGWLSSEVTGKIVPLEGRTKELPVVAPVAGSGSRPTVQLGSVEPDGFLNDDNMSTVALDGPPAFELPADASGTGLGEHAGAGVLSPRPGVWPAVVAAVGVVLLAGAGVTAWWLSSRPATTGDAALVRAAGPTVGDEVELDDEPEEHADDGEPSPAAETSADDADKGESEDDAPAEAAAPPTAVSHPAPEAPPAPPSVRLNSVPSGASVQVLETGLAVGTTPVSWVPDDAIRARLASSEAVTLIVTMNDGRRTAHVLKAADLTAATNDLTITLPSAPKPKATATGAKRTTRPAQKAPAKPRTSKPAAPKPAPPKPAAEKPKKAFSLF